jgi:hypothetical protein
LIEVSELASTVFEMYYLMASVAPAALLSVLAERLSLALASVKLLLQGFDSAKPTWEQLALSGLGRPLCAALAFAEAFLLGLH